MVVAGRRVPRRDARGRAGSRTRAASPRCTTRTAGSARCGSGSSSRSAGSCRCASGSRSRPTSSSDAAARRAALGLRQPDAAPRLPEGVHGRHARLADGVDARRQRRADHERRRSSRRSCAAAPRRASRSRVHAIGDRANREALDAFERDARRVGSRSGSGQRIEHCQLLAPEDLPRFAELGIACSVQFSHAPSDRDLADRFWARQDRRRLRVPLAARLGRRRRERHRRADRGARPARGHPRRRAAHDRRARRVARGAGAHGRRRRSTRRASRRRGSRATSAAAAR